MKTNLRRAVRSYLRFLKSGAIAVPYEARQELKRRHIARLSRLSRAGFTLVEMLVAVSLVLLMMTLFATIFQVATSGMAVQKGTAENDQKVRLVATLLRQDIARRTFRKVLPFSANDPVDDTDRKGYFYIGENDPDDSGDDVLQFTAETSGDELYYGHAVQLTATGMDVDPNQPEFDDKFAVVNNVGSSQVAEVVYYLRHGTLYRRVTLVRLPIITTPTDATPRTGTSSTGPAIALDAYRTGPTGTKNFYTDFDYSAYYDPATTEPVFNFGTGSMSNLGAITYELGRPKYRFGFDQATGLPREFTTHSLNSAGATVATPRFFGRYTQEETSFFRAGTSPLVCFGYPGRVTGPGTPGLAGSESPNPYDATINGATGNPNVPITLNDKTGKVVEYTGGSRISEDILMTGVLEFDVKVWDDGASYGPDGVPGNVGDDNDPGTGPADTADILNEMGYPNSDDGAYVDVGHAGFMVGGTDYSFYSAGKLNNAIYCPTHPIKPATRQYRFDTWHPQYDAAGDAVMDDPPYRAPAVVSPPLTVTRTDRQLRSIQIRLKFFDQTSQQVRDATLQFSLTDDAP